eukprot:TRINITY_DN40155_c0_g1_i2.p1 TRINITY_DN40155_c0_g1~~TRINITY_DN40155_c0_g1_i2.p1  ORF type:complete len:170 (-),score=55.12 TRINITY_DN40155_c0_g1_i2:52-561(-)
MASSGGRNAMAAAAASARSWMKDAPEKAKQAMAQKGGPAAGMQSAVKGSAEVAKDSAKKVHGFIQKKLESGESKPLGLKWAKTYGSQKRDQVSTQQQLMPYIATAVLGTMIIFFVVLPVMHQKNYTETKQKYEALNFARDREREEFARHRAEIRAKRKAEAAAAAADSE